MRNFEQRLTGGNPNSLGNTIEVVDEILFNPDLFEELFDCYFCDDEVVRLRVSNAMKRIGKERKDLLVPYVDRFLEEVSTIDQASTQWTLATLFDLLRDDMTLCQKIKAYDIVKNNLATYEDWIVLNTSMEVLYKWGKEDPELITWMIPHLERLSVDGRKSVARKAHKLLEQGVANHSF